MSVSPITFEGQDLTAKADGGFQAALMSDGKVWGCNITLTSSSITIAKGEIILCGRIVKFNDSTTTSLSPTVTNGYGRLILNTDLSASSPVSLSTEFVQSSFEDLTTDDINDTGTQYQLELARFTIVNSQANDLTSIISSATLNNNIFSAIKLAMYPVGSIYMSASSTNPSSIFGGTWEAWGQGRVPVGVGSNGTSTYGNNATGGSESVILTTSNIPSHNHTFTGSASNTGGQSANHYHTYSGTTSSNGSHSHVQQVYAGTTVASGSGLANFGMAGAGAGYGNSGQSEQSTVANGAHTHTYSGNTGWFSNDHTHSFTPSGSVGYTGGGSAVDKRQPYITCYMWKRTA